ncbi:hypothetical protein KOW79_005433 [Hemibagrus wyckioides]|uniref:Uncharacterized protein n=1 Tax=Hemibagrus wyckioides TaxID=337641 RepID=A0A9D3NZK8_9TELE|nr:hypothetical protein KOW79_005433 [Hemibagrus wyckioides]
MTKGSSSRLRDASEPPRTNILAELCLPGTYSPRMAAATTTRDLNDVTKNSVSLLLFWPWERSGYYLWF